MSVDVEPDGFQQEAAASSTGYDAAISLVEDLRPAIERATGRPASFGWFFRMDPQVTSMFGRPDHFVSAFGSRVPELTSAGDHLGLHTHLVRWSTERTAWVHDVTDEDLVRQIVGSSFEAFREATGAACERHRMGAGLYTQAIVDALAYVGARVDSAFEPVSGPGVDGVDVESGVDSSPLVGRNTDCATSPRRAYHPAAGDFRQATSRSDGLAFLPLSSSWLAPARPAWRTVAGHAVKRGRRPPVRMLYLGSNCPPVQYWDVMARQLRMMRRPYANIAFRTASPGSPYLDRVRAMLEALASHPIASRIEVVDPLEVLPQVL